MIINRLIFLTILISVTCFGAEADSGAKLFEGTKSFKNGGVACIACHNVNSPVVVSGGSLAKDLTEYGGADMAPTIQYMVAKSESMPSPIMVEAYKGKELTSQEVTDLIAFFQKVDKESKSSGFGSSFWLLGVLIAGVIFFLLTLLGKTRTKHRSVNQDIYDRQLKSTWRE